MKAIELAVLSVVFGSSALGQSCSPNGATQRTSSTTAVDYTCTDGSHANDPYGNNVALSQCSASVQSSLGDDVNSLSGFLDDSSNIYTSWSSGYDMGVGTGYSYCSGALAKVTMTYPSTTLMTCTSGHWVYGTPTSGSITYTAVDKDSSKDSQLQTNDATSFNGNLRCTGVYDKAMWVQLHGGSLPREDPVYVREYGFTEEEKNDLVARGNIAYSFAIGSGNIPNQFKSHMP